MGVTTGGSTIVSAKAAPVPPRARIPDAPAGVAQFSHHLVRAVIGRMPPPAAPTPPVDPLLQAQQLVHSEMDPLYRQLTGAYTGQAQAGAEAIRQLTAQYAHEMGGLPQQLSGIYSTAEQGTAAANDALANRLSGAGNADSDALAARLASINEPGAVNPAVQQVAANATGAGNALYGTGNAALDQLLGQSANAQTYAAKQPGIAREAGLQGLSSYEGQIGTAEAKALSDLAGKAPGLVNGVYGTLSRAQTAQQTAAAKSRQFDASQGLKAREFNAGQAMKQAQLIEKGREFNATATQKQAAADFLNWYRGATVKERADGLQAKSAQFYASLNQKTAQANAALTERTAKDNASIAQGNARLAVSQQNANTAAYRATHPAAKIVGTDKTGRYVMNGDGSFTQLPGRLGKPVAGSSSGSTDRLIANHLQGMYRGTAARYEHQPNAPDADPNGFVQVPGTGQGASYTDALDYAAAAYGGNRAKALAAVNRIYPMGENGRPYEGKAAVKAAVEGANAAYAARVPYGDALKAARATGKYPDKVLVAAMRKVYYIDHAYSPDNNGVPPAS